MKLVSFLDAGEHTRAGLYVNGKIADLQKHAKLHGFKLPNNMLELLSYGDHFINIQKNDQMAFKNLKPALNFIFVAIALKLLWDGFQNLLLVFQ